MADVTSTAGRTVDHARGLAAVARRLTPAHDDSRSVLDGLRQHAGEDTARAVRTGLTEAERRLTGNPVRIVFGGHFSSGKSTMINMLLGQPLLPVGDYPETGVPCVIAAGSANSVRLTTGRSVRFMPFSTASIAACVSLIGDDGRQRPEIADHTRLDVTVAGGPIARNAVWIDSPGINDTREMTDRATAVADEADLLVWLVTTRQPLSEVEAELLRGYVQRRGPASVVFLVNAFLDQDSREQWDWFMAERASYHRHRIRSILDTAGVEKRIVFASARGASADPDSFGGPQARALLGELSAPTLQPRVAATRAFTVRAALRLLADDLGRRADAEAARLAEERAAHQRDQVAARRRYEAYLAAVRTDVGQLLADHRPTAALRVTTVTTQVNATPRPAGHWGDQLREGLTPIGATVATAIAAAIATQALRHGQPAPSKSAHRKIAAIIGPPAITVATVAIPGVGGRLAAGSAAGFAAGTVVPVLGHVVGTAAGAIIGGWRAKSVRDEAVGRLRSAVREAGNAAVAAMFDEAPIMRYVKKASSPAEAGPAPDEARLASLRRARAYLVDAGAGLPEIPITDGGDDR